MKKIPSKSASSDFCSQSTSATSAEGDNDTEVILGSDESNNKADSPFHKEPQDEICGGPVKWIYMCEKQKKLSDVKKLTNNV